LNFGIMPEAGMGRADLPVEVETWLLPVQKAIERARKEAVK
jgi:hypothetical protein